MAIDKKKKEAVKTVVKITDAEEKKKALDTAIAYIEGCDHEAWRG